MKKRGQFYIVAAIIISIIILGLASLSNYASVKEEPARFYDLSEQIELEGARVIDNKIYTTTDNSADFSLQAAQYATSLEPDAVIIFIYGNKDKVNINAYTKASTGEISLEIGGQTVGWTGEGLQSYNPGNSLGGGKFTVSLLNQNYDFNLKQNENFMIVLAKKQGDEIYVAD